MSRYLVLAVAAFGMVACDDGNGGTGGAVPIEFTGGAVESLPQLEDASGADAAIDGDILPAPLPAGTIADFAQLRRLFKLECHLYPQVDYCPSDVDVAENDGMNSTKFSLDSLLGLVFHAEMYGGGHRSSCGLTSGSVSAGSFVAAEAGGDPAKYVVDFYSMLDCRGTDEMGMVTAYSIDSRYQATLTARYHAPDENGGPDMTDLSQVYVALTEGSPTLLAFNFAGANGAGTRAVLIVNLVDHRFAVKTGGGDEVLAFVNAIGVGGVDRESGAEHAGHYFARFTDDMGVDTTACVNNVGQIIEDDSAACAAESVPVAWDGADSVAEYLGMTADERTRLAGFLGLLADSEPLSADQVPQDVASAETNFPKGIQ